MDDVTNAHEAVVQDAEIAAAEPAHEAPATAAPAAPAAKEPEPYMVTLDDYCAAKSKKLHGHIELISAFNTLETRKRHLLDTTDRFDADFEALRTRKAN